METEFVVENVSTVKAVDVKLTLIIKEFLNEKQAFFREDYELAAHIIRRHIHRHNMIHVFQSHDDAKKNIGGQELIINHYNATEYQNKQNISLVIYTRMSEQTYMKLRGKSVFSIQKTFLRKQFEPHNSIREIDLSIEITNKLNVETINDTFINKIDAIENTLSYLI